MSSVTQPVVGADELGLIIPGCNQIGPALAVAALVHEGGRDLNWLIDLAFTVCTRDAIQRVPEEHIPDMADAERREEAAKTVAWSLTFRLEPRQSAEFAIQALAGSPKLPIELHNAIHLLAPISVESAGKYIGGNNNGKSINVDWFDVGLTSREALVRADNVQAARMSRGKELFKLAVSLGAIGIVEDMLNQHGRSQRQEHLDALLQVGSPLSAAATAGHVEVLRATIGASREAQEILKALIDDSIKTNAFESLLWHCVRRGDREALRYVVDCGVTLDELRAPLNTHLGRNVFHELSARQQHPSLALLRSAFGSDAVDNACLTDRDTSGSTAVELIATAALKSANQFDIVYALALMEKSKDGAAHAELTPSWLLDPVGYGGETVLHIAARKAKYGTVCFLLGMRAFRDMMNSPPASGDGQTPSDYALMHASRGVPGALEALRMTNYFKNPELNEGLQNHALTAARGNRVQVLTFLMENDKVAALMRTWRGPSRETKTPGNLTFTIAELLFLAASDAKDIDGLIFTIDRLEFDSWRLRHPTWSNDKMALDVAVNYCSEPFIELLFARGLGHVMDARQQCPWRVFLEIAIREWKPEKIQMAIDRGFHSFACGIPDGSPFTKSAMSAILAWSRASRDRSREVARILREHCPREHFEVLLSTVFVTTNTPSEEEMAHLGGVNTTSRENQLDIFCELTDAPIRPDDPQVVAFAVRVLQAGDFLWWLALSRRITFDPNAIFVEEDGSSIVLRSLVANAHLSFSRVKWYN